MLHVSSLSAPLAFALLAFASASARAGETATDGALREALVAATTVPEARLEIVAVDRPSGTCVTTGPDARIEASRPIDGSGRIAVKLVGRRDRGGGACEIWAWVRVRVFAKVPVARRSVRMGEQVAPAVAVVEREIMAGRVPASFEAMVTNKSVAMRSFGVGQLIEAEGVSDAGPRVGDSLEILIVAGSLAIEETGRAIPCARGRTCAVLPSGKHIEGTFVDGRLVVQLP
jgi:hypothetical protein